MSPIQPAAPSSIASYLVGRQWKSPPTFAMFVFESGARLALWDRNNVEPIVSQEAGAMELAFPLPDDASVDIGFAKWQASGLTIAQAPTRMEFGYTCMALDPDGHRLRLYCPAPELA